MKKLLFLGVVLMLSLNLSAAKRKAETPLTPDTTPRIIEIATANTAILLTVTHSDGDLNTELRKVFESSVHVIEEVK
jgi:hypothetical protein